MFASDVHGPTYYCRKMLGIYSESETGRLVILEGILYHGPHNDLPEEYTPEGVITMPNLLKNQVYAIGGNCDTEAGQMVLEFPIMADYGLTMSGGKASYATYGHVYNQDHLPPLQDGDTLVYGHTHILKVETIEAEGGRHIIALSPGSVSIPRGGNPSTYAMLEDKVFSIRTLEGEAIKELKL